MAKPRLLHWQEDSSLRCDILKSFRAKEQQVVMEDWRLLSLFCSSKLIWRRTNPLYVRRGSVVFLCVKDTGCYHAGPFNSVCQSDWILYVFLVICLQKYAWVSLLLAGN